MSITQLSTLNTKVKDRLAEVFKGSCFEGITKINFEKHHRDLVHWLIRNYNPVASVLRVNDMTFHVTDALVGSALGVPSTGQEIIIDETDKTGYENFSSHFSFNQYDRVVMSDLRRVLEQGGQNDQVFELQYLVYAFGVLLFPEMSVDLHCKFLNLLVDMENLHKKNWAKLIRETTNEAVAAYQKKPTYMTACPFLLEVQSNFFDTCHLSDYLA